MNMLFLLRGLTLLIPVVLIGIFLGCTLIASPRNLYAETNGIDDIITTVWKSAKTAQYAPPKAQEALDFKRFIKQVSDQPAPRNRDELKKRQELARNCGFTYEKVRAQNRTYWVVSELPPRYRGGGIYLFKEEKPDDYPLLLEAPHAKSDINSEKIALHVFINSPASALFMNSIKRNCTDAEEDDEIQETVSPCDLAHNTGTYFHQATIGYLQAREHTLLIQFHGFKPNPLIPGSDGDLYILSTGKAKSGISPVIEQLFTLFTLTYPNQVRIFGRDINVLGASTNVQGMYMHKSKKGRFIHIEISKTARDSLSKPGESLNTFIKLIQDVLARYKTEERFAQPS